MPEEATQQQPVVHLVEPAHRIGARKARLPSPSGRLGELGAPAGLVVAAAPGGIEDDEALDGVALVPGRSGGRGLEDPLTLEQQRLGLGVASLARERLAETAPCQCDPPVAGVEMLRVDPTPAEERLASAGVFFC
jgi:hypothetical protein